MKLVKEEYSYPYPETTFEHALKMQLAVSEDEKRDAELKEALSRELLKYNWDVYPTENRQYKVCEAANLAKEALHYWTKSADPDAGSHRMTLYMLLGDIQLDSECYLAASTLAANSLDRAKLLRLSAAAACLCPGGKSRAQERAQSALETLQAVKKDRACLWEVDYLLRLIKQKPDVFSEQLLAGAQDLFNILETSTIDD